MGNLALKSEAEDIRDKAHRIVALILARQAAKLYQQGSEDEETAADVTAAMRQEWNAKIAQLQAQIKAITETWV